MPRLHRLLAGLLALALLFGAAPPVHAKLDEKDFRQAKSDLEQGLAAKNADQIAAACERLGEDQSARAVKLLVSVGKGLEEIKVYEAVKRALGGMTEKEAVDEMVKSVKGSGDWEVRCVLVDCLSAVQADGVTEAIARGLEDKVPYVI